MVFDEVSGKKKMSMKRQKPSSPILEKREEILADGLDVLLQKRINLQSKIQNACKDRKQLVSDRIRASSPADGRPAYPSPVFSLNSEASKQWTHDRTLNGLNRRRSRQKGR